MDNTRVNNLNSVLICASALVAWYLPFELFLFAYAVLGPLHYLTEIHWLHKKDYFIKERSESFIFVLGGIIMFMGLFVSMGSVLPTKIMLGLFIAALIMILNVPRRMQISLYVLLVLVLAAMPIASPLVLIFLLFLPTLIHVYVFTGAFMLFGALKERSVSGYRAFALFLTVPLALFFLGKDIPALAQSSYVINAYHFFLPLNKTVLALVSGGKTVSDQQALLSGVGVAVMKCVAFAYSYHYLNWFSKAQVIKWNKIQTVPLMIILALWFVAVGCYFIDYRLGIFALYFLSMLHVLLEFPLDHRALIGIGTSLKERLVASTTVQ